VFYPVGDGELADIEIGPGLVSMFGGAPGAGKTAFVMQCVFDALRLTPDLRACVCNIEMPVSVLLDRQLSRLSGIDLKTVRCRRFGPEHAKRIEMAMDTLDTVSDRLVFCRAPYNLENVAATMDAFGASLVLLDYIQRIPPPGDHKDNRRAVNATMDFLRQFADNGAAVIVVSAVGRTKDSKGKVSYDGNSLNLASFRESSELEFGCDDAFILAPAAKNPEQVVLRHLKARHTEAKDITLDFDGSLQRFIAKGSTAVQEQPAILKGLADYWLNGRDG
jgi:replicative DNA helicase